MSDRRFNGESGEIMKFDYQWKQSWEFKTEVSQTIGGYEQRRARWHRPLRSYTLPMNNKTLAKINTLKKFFYDHQGQAESFLFYDPSSKNKWIIPRNSIVYGNTVSVASNWTDICYNSMSNKFVMTGLGRTTAYSNDGVLWTSSTMPVTATYWTVCHGSPYTVAVGYGGNKSAYSENGTHWLLGRGLPYSANWRSVAYGNGSYVAVGDSGKAAYSTNGVSWNPTTVSNYSWYDVAYGDGTFVTVGLSPIGGLINYSLNNGVTWASATVTSGIWISVAYGSGTFVAVGNTNGKVITSTNGITWSSATIPTTETLLGLSYGNGKFVALVNETDRILYSTTGTVWASATLPSALAWWATTYGDDRFVAVPLRTIDNKSTKITAYSTDATTWTYTPSLINKIYLPHQNIYPLDSTPVWGSSGNIRLWVSGTERTSNMTINQQEGSITFTSDYPEMNQEIEVEYSYYVRVRFNSDLVEISEQRYNLDSLVIELKEVR